MSDYHGYFLSKEGIFVHLFVHMVRVRVGQRLLLVFLFVYNVRAPKSVHVRTCIEPVHYKIFS